MAGFQLTRVLMVVCATVALNYASTLPREINFPTANGDLVENSEPIVYPPTVNDLKISEQEDRPKGCFHFYVSRNMSSLLADATKMLRNIRDRREREWILTFIYRIKSLAEHLRAHPDSRNYDCLPNDEEGKKRFLSDNIKGQQQQPELYFVDDVPKRSNEGEELPEKVTEENPIDNEEFIIPSVRAEENNPIDNEELINPSMRAEETYSVDTEELIIPSVRAREQPESSAPTGQEPALKPPTSKFQTESSVEIASDSTLTKSDDEHKDSILSKQDVTTSVQEDSPAHESEDKDAPSKREPTGDNSIIISSAAGCDSECRSYKVPPSSSQNSPESYVADAANSYPMYQARDASEQEFNKAAELYQREVLKGRIRKALLEELAPEIKKLRTVGGTENDLMSIWNSNFVQAVKLAEENEENDFDYEETGAAAGDLNLNENVQPDRTVAPSLDEVQNSKENSNIKDSSYEPYDDSDVLVQQLFDVRYNNPPSKTTKSLSDQNNEYLITSTHSPF